MVWGDFAAYLQSALFGGAHQIERGARGEVGDVEAAARQLGHLDISRDGDRFGSGGGAAQGPAAPSAPPPQQSAAKKRVAPPQIADRQETRAARVPAPP